jgi:hypothetical protein
MTREQAEQRLRHAVHEAFCAVDELAGHPRIDDVIDHLVRCLGQPAENESLDDVDRRSLWLKAFCAVDCAVDELAGHPRIDDVTDHLVIAEAGFHRIGRLDAVGRRSLWLLEEAHAVTLRAGREGADSMLRIEADSSLYQRLKDVLSTARFAAEWEIEGGSALDASYALDRNPRSIHCSDVATTTRPPIMQQSSAISRPDDLQSVLYDACADPDRSSIDRALDLMLVWMDAWWTDPRNIDNLFTSLDPTRLVRSIGQTLLARTDMPSRDTSARRAFVDRFLVAESARGASPETIDRLRRAFTATQPRHVTASEASDA